MLRTILVPLDGSPLAERALPYAEAIARHAHMTLLLVRMLKLPSSATALASLPGTCAPEAEAYLAEQADRLTARGLSADTRLIYGDAAAGITQEATSRGVEMIVMATHGRTGLGRLVFGSVAEEVLRHTTAPLLLVRAWEGETAPPSLDARPRILVPLDGSPFAEEALPVAVDLTTALRGALVLLQAVSPLEPVAFSELAYAAWPESQGERLTSGQEYLRGLVTRGATGACPVHWDVRLDIPTIAIADAARDHGAALVVMATHGRGALSRLVLGGVAHATLLHTRLPLLLIRPQHLVGGNDTVTATRADTTISPSLTNER